ncbi:glycerol transporter [Neopestalotiopsis sp. 37M]|nr:glycerol transporter [Neopestalotiopsis sp. 37M]
MGVLSFFRSIYDLDTLDTRFTTSSSTPYKTVVESRGDAAASKERAARFSGSTTPSKWKTPEFFLYILLVGMAIPTMVWVAYNASTPSNPQFRRFEPYLAQGWIPGRKIDLSDAQYFTFRKNIPYMSALLLFHPLLRRLYNAVVHPVASNARSSRPTLEEADDRLKQRTSFDFGFAIIFLLALHGVSAFKVLAILYVNYQIATRTPRKSIPAATWIFNIGILFANETFSGYKLANMAMFVSRSVTGDLVAHKSALVTWAEWLDSYGGIMSRWQILFNITVLRLISFNMDYYWSLDRRSYSPVEKKQIDPASLSERDRVTIPAQSKDFSFRNYIAYAIYAPLYLTGPILTFNDYISQNRYQPATIERSRTIRYGIRFALTLLTMEVILHYDYVQAISKANPLWGEYTAAQLSILSYFNLIMVWLKLLLPWRLFRLWSLIDGIDPPENMLRCVSNNYSTLAFWRSWHRSYNRWLTRYIYIPLGGSSFATPKSIVRSIFNYILTFTFVALWHDIKLRLLIWGWLIVLFMLPEMTARALFPARKWENSPKAYQMLSGVGAVVNIFMMMMANLVGYAVGVEGLQAIIRGIFKDISGFSFLLTACCALFCAAQIMMEQRESELRRGISLKC